MNAVGIGWLQEESGANVALVEEVTRKIHQVIGQHGVAIAGVTDASDAGNAAGEWRDVSSGAAA